MATKKPEGEVIEKVEALLTEYNNFQLAVLVRCGLQAPKKPQNALSAPGKAALKKLGKTFKDAGLNIGKVITPPHNWGVETGSSLLSGNMNDDVVRFETSHNLRYGGTEAEMAIARCIGTRMMSAEGPIVFVGHGGPLDHAMERLVHPGITTPKVETYLEPGGAAIAVFNHIGNCVEIVHL